MRAISEILLDRVADGLLDTDTLTENFRCIEKYMVEYYLISMRRAEVYDLIDHDTYTVFIDIVQNVVRTAWDYNPLYCVHIYRLCGISLNGIIYLF